MVICYRNQGTSLVEVLMTVMFLGLFVSVLHQFSRTMVRGVGVLEAASEAQAVARIAIERISRDLRETGYGSPDGLEHAVAIARWDAITIVRDFDGDGATDGPNERVGYSFNADKRALMRTTGKESPQPMVSDLAPNGLVFGCFDADAVSIPVEEGGLDSADRDRIRRVDVRIAIDIPHPDPSYRTPIGTVQTATIVLRNR